MQCELHVHANGSGVGVGVGSGVSSAPSPSVPPPCSPSVPVFSVFSVFSPLPASSSLSTMISVPLSDSSESLSSAWTVVTIELFESIAPIGNTNSRADTRSVPITLTLNFLVIRVSPLCIFICLRFSCHVKNLLFLFFLCLNHRC